MEVSTGVEPRIGRAVVLGFKETRLGLWARELERSLATSRAEALEVLFWDRCPPVDVAVVDGLLAVVDPTLDGFLLIDASDFCEGVSEVVDLDLAEAGPLLGASGDWGAVSECAGGSWAVIFGCRFVWRVSGRPSAMIWAKFGFSVCSRWLAGVGEAMFCRLDSTFTELIFGPNIPGLSLRPLVFLNGEAGLDCRAPSTFTKLARTLDNCRAVPEVSDAAGDLPREGGEVIGLWPSNLASKLRTPG